jgi:hypothetical protein
VTCDAKGCEEPAVAYMTYWVREFALFHLCRGHWEKIGSDGREELWRELGIPRPPGA